AGRSREWLKTKCSEVGRFVITGCRDVTPGEIEAVSRFPPGDSWITLWCGRLCHLCGIAEYRPMAPWGCSVQFAGGAKPCLMMTKDYPARLPDHPVVRPAVSPTRERPGVTSGVRRASLDRNVR